MLTTVCTLVLIAVISLTAVRKNSKTILCNNNREIVKYLKDIKLNATLYLQTKNVLQYREPENYL